MSTSLFRVRAYRHQFGAQLVALAGNGLATVALGLLAFEVAGTRAAAVPGTALTIKMVAFVVVAPIAAALPDILPDEEQYTRAASPHPRLRHRPTPHALAATALRSPAVSLGPRHRISRSVASAPRVVRGVGPEDLLEIRIVRHADESPQ